MNRKKLMMILATTTIIATMIFPMLLSQLAIAAEVDYDPDYMTVSGVLSTDTYVLFPYPKNDLKIGFSKYGEMIDRDTQVGLEYDGATDPFAGDPAAVAEYEWVEGWILDITYEIGGQYRNRWAFALHSDYYNASSIDGPWQEGVTVDPTDPSVLGGRKTSGGAVTDDIVVLYDGPRRFVGLCHTIIYEDADHTYPLVDLMITVVFNKVKKIVILYKDIKRLDTRKSVGDMQIEFSERGQWDLGGGAPPKSSAHIFEEQSTVYNNEYQSWYTNSPSGFDGTYDVCQIIDDATDFFGRPNPEFVAWAAWWPKPITSYVEAIHLIGRDTILNTMSTHEETWNGNGTRTDFTIIDFEPVPEPRDNVTGNWSENPMVFVDNVYQVEDTHYTYNATTNTITFLPAYIPPVGVDNVKAVYKIDASRTAMSEDPGVPFTNAEWCFVMDETYEIFRAVTVYGVAEHRDGSSRVIDRQVQFYLDETFNPYDLKQAVHKNTRRWVEIYKSLTSATDTFELDNAPMVGWDVEDEPPEWDAYCTFAERVLVDGVLQIPDRSAGFMEPSDYTLSVDSTTGVGTITFDHDVPAGSHVKILYSTEPYWWDSAYIDFTDYVDTAANETSTLPRKVTKSMTDSAMLSADPLRLQFGYYYYTNVVVDIPAQGQPANFTETLYFDLNDELYDLKVTYDPNDAYEGGDVYAWTYDTQNETGVNFTATLVAYPTYIYSNVTALRENTYIDFWQTSLSIAVTVVRWSNATHAWTNTTISPEIYYYYVAHQEGTYEWMIVGKDAATIDSAGAAYMTQAFDSKKQIHVQMTGLDFRDPEYGANAPYVMAGATTGTRADYYYSATDDRCALADDWCTTYPVASSNMLFAGGPRANLGTEYFNEFTMAFYARHEHVTTDIGQSESILALSCWDRNAYKNIGFFGFGYATISVYKDLNGTIGFLVWGNDGQDTYYAAKWLWESTTYRYSGDGIYVLQDMNDGVTDLILWIYYPSTDPIHPRYYIVERLGTISEKDQHDCPSHPDTFPIQ